MLAQAQPFPVQCSGGGNLRTRKDEVRVLVAVLTSVSSANAAATAHRSLTQLNCYTQQSY